MSQQYILILTIGPVQSFIAEARRTADLYTGSQMLAQVARAAARALQDNGSELIYPVKESLELEQVDTPNKLVALVVDPTQAADLAKIAAETCWRDYADKALGKLIDQGDATLEHTWKHQRGHLLEFYWAAAEFNGNYPSAYKMAAAGLAARKQTRNFEQGEEQGFKDSLSGNRSALRTTADKDARDYWKRIRRYRSASLLQKNELLDTIGAMKRFALEKKFPSVSTVASASFARACNQAGLLAEFTAAIEDFNRQEHQLDFSEWPVDTVEALDQTRTGNYFYPVEDFGRGFRYDGDLLYPETYTRERLRDSYSLPPVDVQPVTAALQELYNKARQKKIKPDRPSPYYAILYMDGDRMGEHIGGCQSKEEHQEVSRYLYEYSQQAQRLVTESGGYLVYAGGDDVIAFFPLECALTGAGKLAKAYFQHFANCKQLDKNGASFPFTASIGLAFAHHLYPLDATLAAARQAEKRAKNRYGRSALCVSVLRRSGETLEMGGKWMGEPERRQPAPDTVEMVSGLVRLLEEDKLSARFPHSVLQEADIITAVPDKNSRAATLRRLVERHRHNLSDSQAKELVQLWAGWANAHDQWIPAPSEKRCEPVTTPAPQDQGFYELARWFILARWLASGGNE